MEGFVNFMTNGNTILWDAWHLMRDPEARDRADRKAGALGAAVSNSPFKANPAIGVPKEVKPILQKVQNVVDFTHYFSTHASKALVYFTILNVAVYHFTRLITLVALTYFVTSLFFCLVYFDVTQIASASEDLKDLLDHTVGDRGDVGENELIAMQHPKAEVRANLTLLNVQLTIRKIERLQENLFLFKHPLNQPLQKIIDHLKAIEGAIRDQLPPPGRGGPLF